MITREEYLELKELYNDGYRWIARDSCDCIYAYKLEPIKLDFRWKYYKNKMIATCGDDFLLLYVYVKWEDVKPTKILDLIKDYEKHVEKEKLYTVKLANGDCLYKFKDIEVGWTNGYSNYENDPDFQLTQSEIESVDPILMQIAKEVE